MKSDHIKNWVFHSRHSKEVSIPLFCTWYGSFMVKVDESSTTEAAASIQLWNEQYLKVDNKASKMATEFLTEPSRIYFMGYNTGKEDINQISTASFKWLFKIVRGSSLTHSIRLQEFCAENSLSAPTQVFAECFVQYPELKIVREVGTSGLTWSRIPP